MRRVFGVCGAASIIGALIAGSAYGEPAACELVGTSLREAAAIRGLEAKRPVPCRLSDQDEVRRHLTELIDAKIPAQKIAGEEELYKAIGLIPSTFNYKAGVIELYVSQLGGYYDPAEKRFVMASWMPPLVQAPIVVHELTHALQDQHFDLEKFVDPTLENGDMLLARSAVAEGDAMAVMADASRRSLGQPGISADANVDLMIAQNILGMAMMPSLREVPEGLKGVLVFPYTSGLRFVHARLRSGGYRAVDAVFRSPPRSTEEILHPELYGQSKPSFAAFDAGGAAALVPRGGKVIYSDVIGEFLLGAVLAGHSADKSGAAAAAQGWGGDHAAIVEQEGTGRRFLVWRLAWDSAADAGEFCALYRRLFPVTGSEDVLRCRASDVEIVRPLGGGPPSSSLSH